MTAAGVASDGGRTRVVYLDHCARLSGGELALARLLEAMTEVDATVVLGEDGPLVARLLPYADVQVVPMPTTSRDLSRLAVGATAGQIRALVGTAIYVVRIARLLRRLRPDLVHTNSLKSAIYGGLAARLARVPVVWHIRDRIADDYMSAAAVRLVRLLARLVPHAVIANSNATLSTLGIEEARGSVIPSPVVYDSVVAPAPSTAPKGERLRIAMVGRLAPWKGQHVLLDAIAKAFPSRDVDVLIVGEALFGEDAYADRLRRQCTRLGLDDIVNFLGFQPDVPALLAGVDVLVHASVVPEPFGQVVIEGMASGLAVIASNEGGPAEIIHHGVDGLLVAPGSPEILADALTQVASDARLRHRLGVEALRRADDFRPEIIVDRVSRVYAELLAPPG